MTGKKILGLIVLIGVLSVFFTSLYYRITLTPTKDSFNGTYQFNSDTFTQSQETPSIDYLAIVYSEGDEEGEFFIYNNLYGPIDEGKCQMDGNYLYLNSENENYLLSYIRKEYYFITSAMSPELLDKISDGAIVQ